MLEFPPWLDARRARIARVGLGVMLFLCAGVGLGALGSAIEAFDVCPDSASTRSALSTCPIAFEGFHANALTCTFGSRAPCNFAVLLFALTAGLAMALVVAHAFWLLRGDPFPRVLLVFEMAGTAVLLILWLSLAANLSSRFSTLCAAAKTLGGTGLTSSCQARFSYADEVFSSQSASSNLPFQYLYGQLLTVIISSWLGCVIILAHVAVVVVPLCLATRAHHRVLAQYTGLQNAGGSPKSGARELLFSQN